MADWTMTLILWLFPVAVAALAWLIVSGVERGIRLRIALAVFVVVFMAILLCWPAIE
jgi:hypothetical protein